MPMRTRSRQRGISLVEALVALVVMSVGMLGIASLYVTSLQTGRVALTRTQAVNLVNDLADRIRANSLARDAYELEPTVAFGVRRPAGTPDCVSSKNCQPSELASIDLNDWLASFKNLLPKNATGAVTYTPPAAGSPDTYVIQVAWSELGQDNSYGVRLQVIPVSP
jgi:type IV pilus assembly protein PilV